MARVSQIYLHPVKSCKGISVDSAEYTETGMRRSGILKIETAFGPNDTLIITVPNDPPEEFSIPLYPTAEDLEDMELVEGVTLFRSTVDGYAVSSEIDEALSVFLKTHVRLILKGPTIRFSLSDPTNAKVDSEHKHTQFQDAYPILVASTASLAGASEAVRLAVKGEKYTVDTLDAKSWPIERTNELAMSRWRPNIVVEGVSRPFGEDEWTKIEIGNGEVLHCACLCMRCMVPNVDPETAERDGAVPWSVLSHFRMKVKGEQKYCFGVNSIPQKTSGTIRVGDSVEVLATADPENREKGYENQ